MWPAEFSDTFNLLVGGGLAIIGTVVWYGMTFNIRRRNRLTNGS
ncbi:hypothetical protein QP179_09935 [Sphingomonas aurantiaca]